jgi:hypothetical protein
MTTEQTNTNETAEATAVNAARSGLIALLVERLGLDLSGLRQAEDALVNIAGASLKETVEGYPLVINHYYLAAAEASRNARKVGRELETIERARRQFIAEGEEQGLYGKLNEQKRADKLAELLEADSEYQALADLQDSLEWDRQEAALTGDQLRRELYNLRLEYEHHLRAETLRLELAGRERLIGLEFDQRCNASEFEKNNRLDVLKAEQAGQGGD